MRGAKILVAVALAVIFSVFATIAAAAPVPNWTLLGITQGSGSTTNVPCSVGSCFSMEVSPGFVIWTNFGPGTDGGIIVGKDQLSGGQETNPASTAPGELSAAWSFFSSNGTFFTSPGGDTQNIYDDAPCSGAGCIGVTTLAVFNIAWNGSIIPMGSAAGCTLSSCTTDQQNGIFVNDYQIDPVTAGAWRMNYAQVVPTGVFANMKFSAIMRGTVTPVEIDNGSCDDNNPCTTDSISPPGEPGVCVHTNNTAACNDGNACTTGDTCSGGVCVGGAAPNCDDGNVCTDDSCDPASGCIHTNNTAACDDGNACTLGDQCSGGVCAGTAISCDDGNACTNDSCDPASGCVHINNTAACNDGDCCTADSCDPATGACVNTAIPGCGTPGTPLQAGTILGLDQGVASASNIPCSTGSCFSMEVSPGFVIWTDFGPGTDGGFVVGKDQACGELSSLWSFFGANGTFGTAPGGGTLNLFDSASCSGLDCVNKTELMVLTVCWNGQTIPMGSPCGVSDYQVNPVTGGAWSMNYGSIVPSSGAFQGVKFSAIMRGTVTPSCTSATDCNDNNVCTTDTCVNNLCVHTLDNGGYCCSPCDPFAGMCDPVHGCPAVACMGSPCDDNDVCTDDTCDPAIGCVHTNNTAACDDGNACTSGDTCSGGICAGTAISCDDGNACTADSCNPAAGACVYTPVPDGTSCQGGAGTCLAGQCNVCPAGSVPSVSIRGGGQKPSSVDLQIQTTFSVQGVGCITGHTDSTVTVTPGTVLVADFTVGNGPNPSSGSWEGNPIPVNAPYTITGLTTSGASGKLILDNKLAGGKDADRMTISAQ